MLGYSRIRFSKMTRIKFLILAVSCVIPAVTPALPKASIHIQTSFPIHTTHPWFLSFGLDSNLVRDHWERFDFSSDYTRYLARNLGPAFVRLMGTDGDKMIFDYEYPGGETHDPEARDPHKPWRGDPPFPPSNFTFNSSDWDGINEFTASMGWRLLFGINGQLRQGPSWDATNALKLLRYSIRKGYAPNLDFELGNEPDLWPGNKNFKPVSGQQLAKDFYYLRDLLDMELGAYFSGAFLVGPDVANGASPYLRDFLSAMGPGVIRAVTFHHYYGGSELSHLDNYTDPGLLDSYKVVVSAAVATVASSPQPQLPIWNGETSSTYSPPPGPLVDEAYVAGFMLLDKLGLSASMGVELVIRQTFYGFWFALIGEDRTPRPNYWTTMMFKGLVGTKVLNVSVNMPGNTPGRLRVYAHCAQTDSPVPWLMSPGAITVYAMNLYDESVTFTFSGPLSGASIEELLLTPGDNTGLLSLSMRVNGQPIPNDFTLQSLKPRKLVSNDVTLPPKTYAFYVLSGVLVPACI